MDRADREALINKLKLDIAETTEDMRERRERLGDETFEPVIRKDLYRTMKHSQHEAADPREKAVITRMLAETRAQQPPQQPHHQLTSREMVFLDATSEFIAEQVTALRADLNQAHADIKLLREELEKLRADRDALMQQQQQRARPVMQLLKQ